MVAGPERVQVAVIGAGIAGLTLAVALAEAGVEHAVYERAPALGEVGAGVQVAPNASKLLRRLGLADRLECAGVRSQAWELRRWQDNTLLGRNRFGAAGERRYGAPYYTLHRADLHEALLELTPPQRVRLGRHCVGLREDANGVWADFADGGQVRAEVVVGADGIRSTVREHLVADATRDAGQCVYRALVPAALAPPELAEPNVTLWLGPGQHAVCYPIRAGELVNLVATAPAPADAGESWTATGRVEDLLAAYAGWAEPLRRLLAAAPEVGVWSLRDRAALTRWHSARVTLVGDAAHPMLPFLAQGANQAVEDAVVLAVCLRRWADGTSDLARALSWYAQARIERTNEVQRVSRERTSVLHIPDGAGQRRRDQALATSGEPPAAAWLYGYDAQAEAAAFR